MHASVIEQVGDTSGRPINSDRGEHPMPQPRRSSHQVDDVDNAVDLSSHLHRSLTFVPRCIVVAETDNRFVYAGFDLERPHKRIIDESPRYSVLDVRIHSSAGGDPVVGARAAARR